MLMRMKGAKLLVVVRCLVTFTLGFFFVVVAIRFGEVLWRAFAR